MMDVKHSIVEYSCLDHTIMVRDDFLEADMVFIGLSVMSHVGFKRQKT